MPYSDTQTHASIITDVDIRDTLPLPITHLHKPPIKSNRYVLWICLLLACLGTSWFAYECFLVPQLRSFAPDWQGAQWVQASTTDAPVTYFRFSTTINAIPDNAFITIAANQEFSLYINSILMGSNDRDFSNMPRAYMYNVSSSLVSGTNTIAVRVANLDDQAASMRLTFGTIIGQFASYYVTGHENWLATTQASNVYSHNSQNLDNSTLWTQNTFTPILWRPTQSIGTAPYSPMLTVNPALYEQPIPTRWMSGGVDQDTYFIRNISLPNGITNTWIRLISVGSINVFVNGHLLAIWNYHPSAEQQHVIVKTNKKIVVHSQRDPIVGAYDISPYIHAGENVIAVHVVAPSINGALNMPGITGIALAMDILTLDNQGHNTWLTSNLGWRLSSHASAGWTEGSAATQMWSTPVLVSRPQAINSTFLSTLNTQTDLPGSTRITPPTLIAEVLALSVLGVLAIWLLVAFLLRRGYRSYMNALEIASLIFLPALAGEALLLALSAEPRIMHPFPYTVTWGLVLLSLVGIGSLLVWLNILVVPAYLKRGNLLQIHRNSSSNDQKANDSSSLFLRLRHGLRIHWFIIPVVLIAIPMISYQLAYEPYWQDELTSYFVAKAIMAHGLPTLPSGFLYAKAELYSYLLALSMAVFGDQGNGPRILSAAEYIITLPVCYFVGCYFFERRTAWLATTMLAFSPLALTWGRQVRMYQQAQLLMIITFFLFFKAVQARGKVRLIYIAVGSLIVMYFSHEETFVLMPSLVICVLVASCNGKLSIPYILKQKHWWFAALIGGGIIIAQLLVVQLTHAIVLGTDPSQRPPIQLTTDNIAFYFDLLFFPQGNPPRMTGMLLPATNKIIVVNSVLAVLGCIFAFRAGDIRIKCCALFLTIAMFMLVFVFTMQADRYFYPIMPMYYFMGSYALLYMLGSVVRFVRSRVLVKHALQGTHHAMDVSLTTPIKVLLTGTLILVCLSVLVVPALPLSSYNLFVSRVTGLSYYHHYPDYNGAGQYVKQNWHEGDIVISIVPDTVVYYYVSRSDYFFSIDRALFLFEDNGQIVDNYTGQMGLLRQQDLQTVLASHGRVWIVSSKYYQSAVLNRFTLPTDFHIVYEGYGSFVYLRGS